MSLNLLSPVLIASIGVIGFLLIVAQMLVGYRKVKFAGRTHMKVHKGIAWALVGITLIHGGLGLVWVIRVTFG